MDKNPAPGHPEVELLTVTASKPGAENSKELVDALQAAGLPVWDVEYLPKAGDLLVISINVEGDASAVQRVAAPIGWLVK